MVATDLPNDLPMDGARRVPWWLYLVTAGAWTIIAWIVLRFNVRSVSAIAALAGVVILVAAAAELMNAFTAPGWKWLHAALGVIFLATGIVALVHPGNTFVWMAAFISWYLLFKGITDIMLAFATKHENDAWWLLLIAGIVELLIGFWAAGNFNRSVYVLVLYVAVVAIGRAVTDVSIAFRLHRIQVATATPGQPIPHPPGPYPPAPNPPAPPSPAANPPGPRPNPPAAPPAGADH